MYIVMMDPVFTVDAVYRVLLNAERLKVVAQVQLKQRYT